MSPTEPTNPQAVGRVLRPPTPPAVLDLATAYGAGPAQRTLLDLHKLRGLTRRVVAHVTWDRAAAGWGWLYQVVDDGVVALRGVLTTTPDLTSGELTLLLRSAVGPRYRLLVEVRVERPRGRRAQGHHLPRRLRPGNGWVRPSASDVFAGLPKGEMVVYGTRTGRFGETPP